MESGTIVKWLKAEGESVQKGEPLYELDTDKVTQEVEADASGVLLKIAVPEGEVSVGSTIAVIGEQGEEVSVSPSSNGKAAEQVDETPQEEARGRRSATPSARRAAHPRRPRPPPGTTARCKETRAAASKRPRWPGGSRASAASISARCAGRARTGGSSQRTSSGPKQPRRAARMRVRSRSGS